MKNIIKSLIVSSIMFVSTAIAGSLGVTGSAKATYRIGGGALNMTKQSVYH